MRSLLLLAIFSGLISCTEPKTEDSVVTDSRARSAVDQPPSVRRSLDICATEWMPFSYAIANRPTGIMIELATDIAKGLGYQARFHFMAPQRCYSETQQGHMDLSLFMSPLALNRQGSQLTAIKPSVQNQMPVLVVKHESSIHHYSLISELSDKKIAGIRGNSFMLKNQDAGPEWVAANQLDYQLLMSERVDAALGDFQSRIMLTPEQQQTVRFVLPPIEIEPIYWAGHQHQPELIQQFTEELSTRLSNGEVDRFYQRHLGMSFTELQQMIASDHYEYPTPTTGHSPQN